MKFKTSKICLTLTLILFFTLYNFSLLSEASRDPQRECEDQCQKQQPYFEEHLCRQRCQHSGRRDEVATAVGGDADVEFDMCQERCGRGGTGVKQWECQRRCQDQYRADLEREGRHSHHGGGGGSGGGGDRDPKRRERKYRHCLKDCDREEEGFPRQRQCKLNCEQEFGGRGDRSHRGRDEGGRSRREKHNEINRQNKKSTKESKSSKETENPYYFNSESFESRYSTLEGNMSVLPRFGDVSDLLLGVERFRVGFYEANPSSFMLPHHWDADSVLFVIRGKATMTLLKQDNRESFDLERGDVLMVPAGTTTYMVNSHENEKLQIAELLYPVNTPGHYEQYFGVGGEEPESFLNTFSTEILQAALNVPKEQVERLFQQQKEGAIVKARREQVRALAQHKMSTGGMGKSRSTLNLLEQPPKFANDHGTFFEVSSNEYPMLEDLDVSVAYCDINQGSMMAPHYNSRTTYIVMVEEGSGYIEMACPHVANPSNKKGERKQEKHEDRRGSPSYKKVKAQLSPGDVFIIPAGHPISIVSSENENLKAVGFGINAYNNKMNFLAGQRNIINLLDREAKELSFNMRAEEVEDMFQKQENAFFMAGPRKERRQENVMASILDFAGF